MKGIIKVVMVLAAVGFSACSNTKANQEKVENAQMQKVNEMKNLVSIVEIPTADFSRAVTFYQSILDVTIEEVDMDGTKMGVLPGDEKAVNVVLVNGNDYKATADGTVVYLNTGNDLQPTLDKVAQNGGQIIVPKTEISPEMGFFALFIDSEGNKLGLHSSN